MFAAIVAITLVGCVVGTATTTWGNGPAWTWPASQELFHSILGNGNLTGCQWNIPGENVVTELTQFRQSAWTGYGFCAPNVETCVHVGTLPRPTFPVGFNGVNCSVCCAYSPCSTYPTAPTPTYDGLSNGYCMLPKLQPWPAVPPTTWNGTEFDVPVSGGGEGYVYDDAEQTCLTIGGTIGWSNVSWWGSECPMSGRCCLYPEPNQCDTCGRKYGKAWNWSKPAMARSDTQDEQLAWKTAVNQMAGTGWNMGMRPVMTPGLADQYSQSPPTYDSLVPPQMWNNFLNRPSAAIKKGDDDDDDEDDHRGWCWQVAILSKLDGSLRCGGALIGERYILTTATCASFTGGVFTNYGVRLGGKDLRKGNEKHAIDLDIGTIFIHPGFNSTTYSNNIAIIELKSAVACNNHYICSICLPTVNMMGFPEFPFGSAHQWWIKPDVYQCLATGWGRKTTGPSSYTPFLKEMIYAPVFNNETYCSGQYFTEGGNGGSVYGNGTFCAVPQPTYQGTIVPICQGDNGGPLACFYQGSYYLTGLSWGGNKCDHTRKSDIVAKVLQPNHKTEFVGAPVDFFTDVVKYIPWISGIISGFHAY
ncbi:hypothetical protein BV898_14860 [Hypsibius exemplaris]|uniref:Peptidase S1 domain-containing protein n=1 Tax=Hypsibius exemplaris TaxID=2072580 RepID=A0A9X6NBG2_HYPEX|nr:hypothetical protein BV898_14860 [Hypsibius exemplaris]